MKNVVTVGGGTGSYTVLSGLKKIPDISLTALVSMADDGGSTGVLMDELGVLPPGDVRQCLVALSEHTDTVRKLMNYRFTEGSLLGHSFGNILLAALEKLTGDFVQGVEVASDILKVNGKVIPVTNDKAELCILLNDGSIIIGEDKINHFDIQKIGIKNIYYKNSVHLNIHAHNALKEADYIILGPGNYYCSVLPNLIVDGFKEALGNSKGKVILPINLTNKQGHTKGWTVGNYVKDIEKYLNRSVDIILVNNEKPSTEQIEIYKLQEGSDVLPVDDMDDMRILRQNFLSKNIISYSKTDVLKNVRSFIRHDGDKLAECIKKIIINDGNL
jgi:uncharacterized cofD-like protein